ncbi:hypothetical protein [Paenibacillus jilunlii]|uniref:hypothetical protein n=1 Tax=Paenibacillus jilunlii TaxID=682956 RepID=UPI000A84AE6B|nr:hypothetical protein [Paenibacillus jilunlii]
MSIPDGAAVSVPGAASGNVSVCKNAEFRPSREVLPPENRAICTQNTEVYLFNSGHNAL